MTWISHLALTKGLTIPFIGVNPFIAIGAVAPDVVEMHPSIMRHREESHCLAIWFITLVFALLFKFTPLIFLTIGALLHLLEDMMTPQGVPIWGKTRIKIFKGIIRTGSTIEYVLSFGILFFSLALFGLGGSPFIGSWERIPWKKLYEQRIIDKKEYLENRFKVF
jgi:membrane-bound metal-dependent hydrolase YbcI (DUF457 family)